MKWEIHGRWLAMVIMLLMILLVIGGLEDFGENASGENVQLIEDAVRRAAIQCYAIEGSYPSDVYYLARHYGLVLDEAAYFYHYEVLGANVMPQIGVYPRWQ